MPLPTSIPTDGYSPGSMTLNMSCDADSTPGWGVNLTVTMSGASYAGQGERNLPVLQVIYDAVKNYLETTYPNKLVTASFTVEGGQGGPV